MSDGNGDNGHPALAAPNDGRDGLASLADVPAALLRLAAGGTVAEANERAGALLATAPSGLRGRSLGDLVDEADRPAVTLALASSGAGAFRVALRDGGSRLVVDLAAAEEDGGRLAGLAHAPAEAAGPGDGVLAETLRHRLDVAERRFRTLVEQLPLVVYVDEPNLAATTLYVSPQVEELLGVTPEQFGGGEEYWSLVHPDDRRRVQELLATQLRDTGRFVGEYRLVLPDGRTVWVRDESVVVRDEEGRPLYVQGYVIDVTEEHAAAEELRVERERFLTLADNIDDVFWIFDAGENRITYVSPAFERVFGLPRRELYRHRELHLERIHADDRAAARQMLAEQLAGVATVGEYRVVHADGSERWIRDRAFPIVEGDRVVRVAGIAEDVTERRRQDAERAELTRRWRELFADAPVMYVVCSLDADGRLVIEDANNALLEVLERDREEVVGRPADAFYDDDSVARFRREALPGPLPFRNRERTLVSASGRRVHVLIDAVPVRGPDGELVSIRGTLTDITAKRAVEERLRADAEALGRLGGLASSEEPIEVKLERVLRIATDRFGFRFGAVVAAWREGEEPSPAATVSEGDDGRRLAPDALDAARAMLFEPLSEVQVKPDGGPGEPSVVGLPLATDGGLPGAMVFAGGTEGFDAGERELLGLMAQWVRYELARERTQAELHESEKVHRSLSESLRRLGERVEAVREEERSRIAREVHDELGQALTALKLDLHWLEDHVSGEGSVRLAHMIEMVEQTIDAVRRVCADLRPPMLDDLGLVAALEWHAANVERASGIACRVRASGSGDRAVSSQVATEAFRITQEALTNVARHAGASSAEVQVHVGPSEIELRIEDDGRGIETGAMSSGLGILGMRERALRVGGTLDVERPGAGGTRVVLRIPLEPRAM